MMLSPVTPGNQPPLRPNADGLGPLQGGQATTTTVDHSSMARSETSHLGARHAPSADSAPSGSWVAVNASTRQDHHRSASTGQSRCSSASTGDSHCSSTSTGDSRCSSASTGDSHCSSASTRDSHHSSAPTGRASFNGPFSSGCHAPI